MVGTLESQRAYDWCTIQFRCMSDVKVMVLMAKNGFQGGIAFSPAYVRVHA